MHTYLLRTLNYDFVINYRGQVSANRLSEVRTFVILALRKKKMLQNTKASSLYCVRQTTYGAASSSNACE